MMPMPPSTGQALAFDAPQGLRGALNVANAKAGLQLVLLIVGAVLDTIKAAEPKAPCRSGRMALARR
jgi:hypothetical protein